MEAAEQGRPRAGAEAGPGVDGESAGPARAPTSRAPRRPGLLLAPGVFLVALAARALALPTQLGPHGLLPGNLADELYHLRRIGYSVARFPEILSFDPYVNFPEGGFVHWPPGFDWTLAAVVRLLVGADDQIAAEHVAAWVPALLGAATALVTLWVGRACFGAAGGAAAALAVAVLPAHVVYSHVGAVDHHVAVSLAGAVALGTAMAWLRAPSGVPGRRLSAGLGLALAVPLLAWPGFLLHAAATQAVLGAAALAAPTASVAARRARRLALAHGVAAAALLPFCLGAPIPQYGAWSPLVLSHFQLTWFGGAALLLALTARVWAGPGGASRGRRVAVALALAAAGLAIALAAAPGLREAVAYASGWFARAEPFQRQVTELEPLGRARAVTFLSHAVYAFPLALGVVAAGALRRRRADLALLLVWAALFLALSLAQNRFVNSFAVPYALVWGGAAAAALHALRGGRPRRRAVRAAALCAGAALLLLALAPVAGFHEGQVRRSLAVREHPERWLSALPRESARLYLGAAQWLARSTPPTRGYLDASVRPAYGILAPWQAGHLLRYVAERPMVQDNFGVYGGREGFERARAYYAATREAEAAALLERLRVRYVVADASVAGSAPQRPEDVRTMGRRLAHHLGSAASAPVRSGDGEVSVPALGRHRLVYHARSVPGRSLRAAPPHHTVAIFERVAGARVTGCAPPGARVEARVRLTTQAGPRLLPRAREIFVYRAHARSGPDGRYHLTLPYPTDATFSDAVRVLGAYELRTQGDRAHLEVPEDAVRAGRRVQGPPLEPASS